MSRQRRVRRRGADLSTLTRKPTPAALAAALAQAPNVAVTGQCPPFVELLAQGLGLSRSDARRAVREGGAYLNNAKVTDESTVPTDADWLHGRFLVLRRGKRAVVVVERDRHN